MIFWIFGPTSPVEVKIAVFWIYILKIWLYFGCLNLYLGCLNAYFGCLNLYRLFWVSELILWVSELISLVLGVWTYTFGHQRTKHSGMTCESGNTEGPIILVWPVNLEILKDWNRWTSGPFGPWDWSAWAPRPFGPGLVPCESSRVGVPGGR